MFFIPGRRIRTLVAMATYSSHRLTMGEVEICNFFCLNVDIWIFFYRNVYLVVLYVSYDLSKSLYLIGCRGGKKGQFS